MQPEKYFDNGNGNVYWKLNGAYHRLDGPAFFSREGNSFWFVYGKKHRPDGPAVVGIRIEKEWWLYGVVICHGFVARHSSKGTYKQCLLLVSHMRLKHHAR
jgi:hypothetical protein